MSVLYAYIDIRDMYGISCEEAVCDVLHWHAGSFQLAGIKSMHSPSLTVLNTEQAGLEGDRNRSPLMVVISMGKE